MKKIFGLIGLALSLTSCDSNIVNEALKQKMGPPPPKFEKLSSEQWRIWRDTIKGVGTLELAISNVHDPKLPNDPTLDLAKSLLVSQKCNKPDIYPALPPPRRKQSYVTSGPNCEFNMSTTVDRDDKRVVITAFLNHVNLKLSIDGVPKFMSASGSTELSDSPSMRRITNYSMKVNWADEENSQRNYSARTIYNYVQEKNSQSPSSVRVSRKIEFDLLDFQVQFLERIENGKRDCFVNNESIDVEDCDIYLAQMGFLLTGFYMDAP